MASSLRIELNKAGVRALLVSPEIQADLKTRADRIAQAAGEGFEAEVGTGANRARAIVRTATFEARRAEARDRVLTRALDAGR